MFREISFLKGEPSMSAALAVVRDPAPQQAEPEHRGVNSASDERSSTRMHEDIARLAYALWQQRGCPVDSAEQDWIEAERQLRQPSQQRPVS